MKDFEARSVVNKAVKEKMFDYGILKSLTNDVEEVGYTIFGDF